MEVEGDYWSRKGGVSMKKTESRYTVRIKQKVTVKFGIDVLLFIHLFPSSCWPLSPLSRFSSPRILESGCRPAKHRTPVCLQPIWMEFARPLKCMFSITFIHSLSCSVFSLPRSPVSSQPRLSLHQRRPEQKLVYFKGTTVQLQRQK